MTTPNFIMNNNYSLTGANTLETKTLHKGTFIRPIHYSYLPDHILEKYNLSFYKEGYEFCYTLFGIVPIPKELITKL